MVVTLGPVSHAELDCEVDAKAYKEHEKGDRDQIKGANQETAPPPRKWPAKSQARDDRRNDTKRTQRKPENDEHENAR
jgi:hypothetical protein